MAGYLHDLVDPRVVHRCTSYESGPQGVSGVFPRIKTNFPGVALYDPRDIAWIEWTT